MTSDASDGRGRRAAKKRELQVVAEGYTRSHRAVETVALAACPVLLAVLVGRASGAIVSRPLSFAVGLGLGYVLADFVSGLVHWFCDTWGTPAWPVVGPLFIRTFREHHTDPDSITRHDVVETNGAICLALSPVLLPAALVVTVDPSSAPSVAGAGFLVAFSGCTALTSQAHKWAHCEPAAVPSWAIGLQRAGLLLSREHHAVHHVAPHTENYCITTGRCDGALARVGFFSRLERLIQAVTGARPRAYAEPPAPPAELPARTDPSPARSTEDQPVG